MHAVLLDIDGTLLRSSGAGATALSTSLAAVLSLPQTAVLDAMARIDFRGATDHAIVAQLETHLAVDLRSQQARLVSAYLLELERAFTAQHILPLPGVLELVALLEAAPDVHVGLLTGNFREAARRKLRPLGLDYLAERAGGFGEDGYHRHELASAALVRLRESDAFVQRVVVIGDTEHDIACGKHIGAKTIAVETGWTPRDALAAAAPDLLLRDLADPGPILALLAEE